MVVRVDAGKHLQWKHCCIRIWQVKILFARFSIKKRIWKCSMSEKFSGRKTINSGTVGEAYKLNLFENKRFVMKNWKINWTDANLVERQQAPYESSCCSFEVSCWGLSKICGHRMCIWNDSWILHTLYIVVLNCRWIWSRLLWVA